MIDIYYALGVFAMVLLFFLSVFLTVGQIKEQERLKLQQEQLEDRTRKELDALREQIRGFKNTVDTLYEVVSKQNEVIKNVVREQQ